MRVGDPLDLRQLGKARGLWVPEERRDPVESSRMNDQAHRPDPPPRPPVPAPPVQPQAGREPRPVASFGGAREGVTACGLARCFLREDERRLAPHSHRSKQMGRPSPGALKDEWSSRLPQTTICIHLRSTGRGALARPDPGRASRLAGDDGLGRGRLAELEVAEPQSEQQIEHHRRPSE